MQDANPKEPQQSAGRQTRRLSDAEMRGLLLEGQELSKKLAESFRKSVTIGEKELSFRFRHYPIRDV